VVYIINQGDVIEQIIIEGDTSTLFVKAKDHLDKWNGILDRK